MLARGGPAGEDDDLADGGGDAGGGWEPWDAPGPGEAGGQDCGPAGFGSGRSFDVLRPGPVLAGAADRVHTGALRRVSDEELTGMIRAWRRLSSWATARELGAIAEFARRRPDEGPGPGMDGDVARRVRARRAASGPPGAAGQAGSAQAPPAGGVNPAAQAGQPGGVSPAAEAGQPGGASPAAEAAQPGGVNPAARDTTAAPATPAGGAGGATPAAPAPAAAPAGGASPAAAADACAGGRPGTGSGFPEVISPFASYELSLALTLTGRSAEAYLDFAVELATKLPKTMAALEAGQIDIIRARIIAEATHVLSAEHTAAVEDRIFPRAGQQTSGQLRAALARAVLAADPGAARARREEAQRDARVLRWREDAGTAALCGRDLPSADVLAADQRISARARDLRSAGVTGTLDELRARAYLDFLLGRDSMPPPPSGQPGTATAPGESPAGGSPAGGSPAGNPPAGNPPAGNPPAGGSPAGNPPAGNPPAGRPAAGDPPAGESPAAGMSPAAGDGPRVPGWAAGGQAGSLAARINVTVPLAAILGLCDTPGEVAAFGPVDADVTRDLIRAAGLHPATRWCVTVVSPDGQAIGHGCAHGRHQPPAFSPDSGTDPPSTGSSPPGTGSSPPSTGGNPPGGGGSPPGGGGSPPSTGGSPPGGGSSPPSGGNSPPGGGNSPLGGGSSPPGGGDGPPGRGGGPGGNGTPGNGGGPGGEGSRGGLEGAGPGNSGGPPGNSGGPPGTSGGPPGSGGGPPGPRHRPGDTAPGPASPPPALSSQARTFIQRLGVTITPLAAGTCDHRNQEPGYTLSPRLRHLIAARTVSCCAPGCRRPAARCDFDHTIAYQAGGRSCECNVRPLCRRHHRCKQAPGWALQQPDPGTMIWTTPAGRTYTTGPTIYHL